MFRHVPQVSSRLSSTFKQHLARKHHFLVLLNDFPGSLAKRFGRRSEHLLKAERNLAIRVGGKILRFYLRLQIRTLILKDADSCGPRTSQGIPFKTQSDVRAVS
jgi:hypothetical protein